MVDDRYAMYKLPVYTNTKVILLFYIILSYFILFIMINYSLILWNHVSTYYEVQIVQLISGPFNQYIFLPKKSIP